jgi:hypothetical protein
MEIQLEKFAVNARCSPGRILGNHTENQRADLFNRLTLETHSQYKRNPARCQFTTVREVPGRDAATVIYNIESASRDRYYVLESDGSKASVMVRKWRFNGHDVIATTVGNTKKDNLELRECRWQ